MIVIRALRDGFRRCGVAHPAAPTAHPDDRFSAEELAVLAADPMLVVGYAPDPDDGEPAPEPTPEPAAEPEPTPAPEPTPEPEREPEPTPEAAKAKAKAGRGAAA